MRHVLDKDTPVVGSLVTYLGEKLRVMPFFGKAPPLAAKGRRVKY